MILKHPTLQQQREVPDSQADRWLATGWVHAAQPTVGDRVTLPALDPSRPIAVLQCPTCAQTGYQPCVTSAGKPAKKYHAARLTSPAANTSASEAATAADQGQHSDEGDKK